jgi:hypothetical protein
MFPVCTYLDIGLWGKAAEGGFMALEDDSTADLAPATGVKPVTDPNLPPPTVVTVEPDAAALAARCFS